MTRIFLARTEEQKRFREVLRSLQPNVGWFSKSFPTVAKLLPAKKEAVSTSPHIFLLYGEGGMGKTSLGRRFYELVGEEFPDHFQVLRLDWEEAKNEYPSLNVGHESIRPESVLETIYLAVSKGREGIFEKYRQVEKTLKQIEDKVDKELQARQGEGAEYAPILKKGLSWSLGALRKLPQVEVLLGAGDGKVDEAIADSAVSALVGLMKKRLSLEERRIFATPHRQLAEALGHGLQAISAQKPLVLLLDTYEIVDRLECDRVLRMVIKAAGRQVVWAIAGRANLADSYRLSQDYFRGYRDEFSENLYVYPMSEFSREQVNEYFAHPEINVPLSDEAAESVKQFSLGIPFVVQQIAAMRQQGIDLATILSAPSADRDDESPREAVVRATSDRFLRYCLDEQDKKAVYAMAMMRRPDNELLKAMLGVTDLEPEMRSLKARHSFVLLEGKGIRLHDKLESFLQDYLRSGLAGQSPMVRELSDRAVAYLEPRLSEWQKEFTDTADYFESDRIANGLLDLVQHKFWQDVEVGWRCAVPFFVESWHYNRDWQKQLLGIIEAFQVRFNEDSKKRLRIFSKDLGYFSFDPDSRAALLDELEKLENRGWLDGDRKAERMLILSLQRGRLFSQLDRCSEAYEIYLETERLIPIKSFALRKELFKYYLEIGLKFLQMKNYEDSSLKAIEASRRASNLDVKSPYPYYLIGSIHKNQGEEELAIASYQNALDLDPKAAYAHYNLGIIYYAQKKPELAIASYQKALDLDPKAAYAHNDLGYAYKAQGKYELAISSYQQALDLDPKLAFPHNGLGIVYQDQGKYELAIASYEQAIDLDPNLAHPHYNLGNVYQDQGEYELAFVSYQKAIDLDPKAASPHNGLGNVYTIQGEYLLAIASYQKAIDLDPKFASPHNNLGQVYQKQGKYELAISSYQKAIVLDPKSSSPHSNLGNVYYDQGEYELAIVSYQQSIDLNPKFANPHNGLGNVYKAQGKLELAISSYQKAINIDPKFAYPHNGWGLIFYAQGKQELAIKSYQKAINLDPKYASPHNNLGDVYLDQGKYELAIASYQKAINLDPKYASPHNGLGSIYQTQREYELASASYQQAIDLDPKYSYPHNNLGNIYLAEGKYELALSSYQKASDLDPKNAFPYNNLGNVYFDQGKYELAIASYQQAINLDPKFAYPHNGLGIVYQAQGEYELAIESYQKAINLDPKDAHPHIGLGDVYYAQGKYELAITSYQQAINLASQYASLYNNLGNAYYAQGKHELAITSYQKAINLDPKYSYPHNGLGNIYKSQGKHELAITSYQQAIDLDPKHAYPQYNLGNVYKSQGKYELAIASYQQAIDLDPKFANPHCGLGNVYQAQGQYELAIASYQQAINLDPKNAYPKFNLGIVMGLQGNQTEAITLWKQGLELLTGNSQYDRLFRALHEVGIGEIERGTNSLREILATEKPPLGYLTEVLKDAELIAQFSTKLEGIDTVIEMLRQAIEKAQ